MRDAMEYDMIQLPHAKARAEMHRLKREPVRAHQWKRAACALTIVLFMAGCTGTPRLLKPDQQKVIDRAVVEYPSGYELTPYVDGLTAPTAITTDAAGSIIIAEHGLRDDDPHIFGFRQDGTRFEIYPVGRKLPFLKFGFRMYGPVGGLAAHDGKIYASHRDEEGLGVITAFGYDGSHSTVVAALPAQGDYGVTDLAIHPTSDRLFFGIGTATNSGVVGLDNWAVGWVRDHPRVRDLPAVRLRLNPYRMTSPNPRAGLFGGNDLATTGPFQSFDMSIASSVDPAPDNKPNGTICSVPLGGGKVRVESHGIRLPRGMAFNPYQQLYFTNNGMEQRGTRPVRDDPDALLHFAQNAWYGWPDFTADCRPITDAKFQPPPKMIRKTGYSDLWFLIDHQTSNLTPPFRDTLVHAVFPPLSGAAGMDFAPVDGPFRGHAIVALSGDRAPFATNGEALPRPVGYKVMEVDVDNKQMSEFMRNTLGVPAHMLGKGVVALERPIDVKFDADGSLYVLDLGRLDMKKGKERVSRGTGRVFKLTPIREPATRPVDDK